MSMSCRFDKSSCTLSFTTTVVFGVCMACTNNGTWLFDVISTYGGSCTAMFAVASVRSPCPLMKMRR